MEENGYIYDVICWMLCKMALHVHFLSIIFIPKKNLEIFKQKVIQLNGDKGKEYCEKGT